MLLEQQTTGLIAGARMGYPKLKPRFTVEQYLAIERSSKDRHEYCQGEIYAMAGESVPHGRISVNVFGLIHGQLRGKSCEALAKDTKVRSGPTLNAGETFECLFSYPDVVVVCEEPQFLDAHKDVLLNPTAIAEVLSPSTEAFDRGEKFTRYQQWNPSLKDYILVSQDKPQIEHFSKGADGKWSYQLHIGLDAVVQIPSIDCTLKLSEVFERIVFPKIASDVDERK
jgi:Uma2 family endonuclease